MAPKRKARLRKPTILGDRRNALVKRNIVKLDQRKAMMDALRKRLRAPNGWQSMEGIPSKNPFFRLFRFGDIKVVIKATYGDPSAGGDWKKVRRDFLTHQKAVRSGGIKTTKYILRSPKVYGLIGEQFLAMECIEDKRPKSHLGEYIEDNRFQSQLVPSIIKSNKLSGPNYREVVKDFSIAINELKKNLSWLKKHGMPETPQTNHMMTTGKYNGKWVFYLPYDYS